MFDPMFDQAAGLRAVDVAGGVRLVPVALSRDTASAFEAAWTLASAISALGYAVAVLDATVRERAHAPGLSQWIRSGERVAIPKTVSAMRAAPAEVVPAWPAVPSQSGLGSLMHVASSQSPRAALSQLSGVFAMGTVVLVLAPKEWLSVLFEDSRAQPLVPLALTPAGVVDAYSTAKVLSQAGGLQPVLMPLAGAQSGEVERRSLAALLATCHRHLGTLPECWALDASPNADRAGSAGAWVLRIVSSALVVDDSAMPSSGWFSPAPQEAPVSQLWSC